MPLIIRDPRLRWAVWVGAAVYLAFALGTLEINWGRVAEGVPRGQRFISSFFPPDFAARWEEILDGIYESMWMTVTSTVVGVAISIPVGLGAARNLSPTPVYLACRALVALRPAQQSAPLETHQPTGPRNKPSTAMMTTAENRFATSGGTG